MGSSKKLRKRLFIDREVQGALLKRVLLQWFCATALVISALLVIEVVGGGVYRPISQHFATLQDKYGMLFLVLLLTMPALAYDAVKMSHRFAGPVFALRVALTKLANGDEIPPLKFRDGDYWGDIAASVNQIAQALDRQRLTQPLSDIESTTTSVETEEPAAVS